MNYAGYELGPHAWAFVRVAIRCGGLPSPVESRSAEDAGVDLALQGPTLFCTKTQISFNYPGSFRMIPIYLLYGVLGVSHNIR